MSSHGSTTRACCAAWPESRELGSILLLHAENPEIVAALAEEAIRAGRTSARDFASSRPAVAELEAIDRALFFAGETGCAVHIVHVSTARGVALIEQARRDGVDATCETCPHYLLFTEDDLERLGVRRSARRRSGRPMTATSSGGCSPAEACLRRLRPLAVVARPEAGRRFFAVWGGISGCQSTLGLILEHGYSRRSLPLETVASITSGGAAARFPLAGKRGLEPGSDADLALVDLGEAWTLQADELLYRHPLSPYVGETVRGRIVRTVVRGRTVYRDGRIVGEPSGRFVGRR